MATRPPPRKEPTRNSASKSAENGSKKSPTRSTAAAGKSSARSTVSGPAARGGFDDAIDAPTAKSVGTEAVAAAFPFNAAKPSEIGEGPPAAGVAVEPPHPMVTGSTLTEKMPRRRSAKATRR